MIKTPRYGYGQLLLALLLSALAFPLAAHPPGLSSVDISLQPQRMLVKITFALQDIEAFAPMDSDLDAEVSDAEREAAKPTIARLLAQQFRIAVDEQDQQPQSEGLVSFDDQNNAHVEFQYPAASGHQLLVQSKLLAQMPEGHREYLTIKQADEITLAENMLNQARDQIVVVIDGTAEKNASEGTFIDFFKLGIEHILTGYDHLLFLLGLLAVTHNFWPALKIITFFTIAHSITLACAGLNLVQLPSSFVEPFIAATIVYVGLENLIRGEHPKGRQWLTFGFGLVHGFGFAGVLQELEISSAGGGILLPLLSFNLGIETGQISVAAIVLPLIWWLNGKASIAPLFLKSCSVAVSLMGAYWLVERTLL